VKSGTQQRDARGWLLVFLAAFVAVMTTVGLAETASTASPASPTVTAVTRVGASDVTTTVFSGRRNASAPGQRQCPAPRFAVHLVCECSDV